MFQRIVVGFHPHHPELAADALALARTLGDPAAGSVTVVAAVTLDGYELIPELVEDFKAEVRDAMSDAISGWSPDSNVALQVVLGTSSRAIHDLAEREAADLIVLGPNHRGRVGQVLGSTAERLLYGSPCPVAIAPAGYESPAAGIRRIGVAFDGSPEAFEAVARAGEIASSFSATLTLMAVLTPPVMPSGPLWTPRPTFTFDEAIERLRHRMEGNLATAIDSLGPDADCETVVRVGEPTRDLPELARDVDLLVAGSRGYGPLRRVLLGSVTRILARSLPVPMLLVPRGETAANFSGASVESTVGADGEGT